MQVLLFVKGFLSTQWRPEKGQGATPPAGSSPEQDLAYHEALEEAWNPRDEHGTPVAKARRRRVTSRAVMVSLSVIAVFLAVGGVLAPQISYAREASRFSEIAAEANAAASEAESLIALEEAERLLLTLRSNEAQSIANQLRILSKSSGKELNPAFKTDIVTAAGELEASLETNANPSITSSNAKKAAKARASETPDPRTWFDVDATQILLYADITPDEIDRATVEGTVTLDRVQEVKGLLAKNNKVAQDTEEKLGKASAKNADLDNTVSELNTKVVAESQRASKAARDRLDSAVEPSAMEMSVAEEEWRSAESALRIALDGLDTAVNATTFAVDADGVIVGVAEGAVLPDKAVRIPGGDMIRLAHVLPKLRAFVSAGEAERKAVEELVGAQVAAEEEAAAIAASEEAGAFSPPSDSGSGIPGPNSGEVPPPGPGSSPAPPPETTPEPPPGPGDPAASADGTEE